MDSFELTTQGKRKLITDDLRMDTIERLKRYFCEQLETAWGRDLSRNELALVPLLASRIEANLYVNALKLPAPLEAYVNDSTFNERAAAEYRVYRALTQDVQQDLAGWRLLLDVLPEERPCGPGQLSGPGPLVVSPDQRRQKQPRTDPGDGGGGWSTPISPMRCGADRMASATLSSLSPDLFSLLRTPERYHQREQHLHQPLQLPFSPISPSIFDAPYNSNSSSGSSSQFLLESPSNLFRQDVRQLESLYGGAMFDGDKREGRDDDDA